MVKYKQFDFRLLLNGKSIERKVFLSILQEFLAVLFQLEPKVKGMFLFTIYEFFSLLYIPMSMGKGRGSNKIFIQGGSGPQLITLSTLQSVFDSGKAFFICAHVASSLL